MKYKKVTQIFNVNFQSKTLTQHFSMNISGNKNHKNKKNRKCTKQIPRLQHNYQKIQKYNKWLQKDKQCAIKK